LRGDLLPSTLSEGLLGEHYFALEGKKRVEGRAAIVGVVKEKDQRGGSRGEVVGHVWKKEKRRGRRGKKGSTSKSKGRAVEGRKKGSRRRGKILGEGEKRGETMPGMSILQRRGGSPGGAPTVPEEKRCRVSKREVWEGDQVYLAFAGKRN